jgi:hypothetical protein
MIDVLKPQFTEDDIVVARRTPLVPVTHVRSTLLASSVQILRAKNSFDAYLKALPAAHHATVLEAVIGSWIPLSVAVAHYTAANSLGLPMQEQFENGRVVAERIQNSLLGTLVRAAKGAGVTPWTGLAQFQRLWDRLLQGGSGAVYKLGPKEARVEAHGIALVSIPYFRNAWRGMLAGSGALFCGKMFVTELPQHTLKDSFVMRVAWA